MAKKPQNDIIVARATPPGQSALAVIRVSGPGSIKLSSEMIPALKGLRKPSARKLIHDFALDGDGKVIDEITAIPYFAPKSYTAEEMVEIICHGGSMASRIIIEKLIECGARPAGPGEFTMRAFINGRISLSQGEAVAAAIEAKSDLALRAAARNLKGELFEKIESIRSVVRDLLSLIEAEIDFSDEEIDKTSKENIMLSVNRAFDKASKILGTYDFGRGLNSGYRIAIVGKANVGKSSLLNALLKRDRAIVTEIPGTTRDTLTEWIEIDGFPILLTDTAGLRESGDTVEMIGQKRTRRQIEDSDLVIFMIDGNAGIDDEDKNILKTVDSQKTILVANKVDLGLADDLEIEMHFPGHDAVVISALKETNLDRLKSRIAAMLNIDRFSLDTALLATERQYRAMKSARDVLAETIREIEGGAAEEVVASFLREALEHLGDLVGETTAEDILNSIFGRFCVGK